MAIHEVSSVIGRTQISRLLAFLGDWALAYILYNISRGLQVFESSYGRWSTLMEGLGLGGLEFPLGVIAFFTLYRFYFFLIFATTPFYGLLGLSCPRSWWFKRMMLPLKALGDGLLLPMAPLTGWTLWWSPDLSKDPLKRAEKNLEESSFFEQRIGVAFIQRPEGLVQSIASFVVFPLFLFSMYSPLLTHLTWLDGVEVSEEHLELNPQGQFTQYHLLTSRRFGLQIMTDFMDQNFQLWPDFQFVRHGTQLRLIPKVRAFHRKREVFITLAPGEEVAWDALLKSSVGKMGPWKGRVNDLMSEESLNEDQCQRMTKLVEDSFRLGRARLFTHTLKFGPFLRGHLQLREQILDYVDGLPQTEVDLLHISSRPVLRLRQRRPLPSEGGERIVHTYLPLCERPAMSFEVSFASTAAHALAYQEFLEFVLSGLNWEEPIDDRIPLRDSDFHVFHFSDFLTQLEADQVESYEAGSLRYLSTMIENLTSEQKELFTSIMRQLNDVTELVQRRDSLSFSREYRTRLGQLLRALKEDEE